MVYTNMKLKKIINSTLVEQSLASIVTNNQSLESFVKKKLKKKDGNHSNQNPTLLADFRPMGYKLSCCGSLLFQVRTFFKKGCYFYVFIDLVHYHPNMQWCNIIPRAKSAFPIYSSEQLLKNTDAEQNPDRLKIRGREALVMRWA